MGLLDRVRELGPLIRQQAETISANRRLTDDVLDGLRTAGVFRMFVTESDCGDLVPLDQIRVLEEVAFNDGSTGWVAMVCCDGPMYASMSATSDALSAELFADPDLLTAGWTSSATTSRGTRCTRTTASCSPSCAHERVGRADGEARDRPPV